MSTDETSLIDRDRLRTNLLPFTRKAFGILPRLDGPNILDIGCGTGVVTLELARLSKGRVVGVDIDQTALDKLKQSIERRIGGLLHGCKKNASVLSVVKNVQREIDEFKTNPEYQGSVFYVCQKTGE
ncbi:MAG: class I SAM-dependent methyltransferase [candidate division WOR-3 bacterium]|nr:MAG: class I SAM-dependent methyltransferase [candidate division WOR-3 bacterium]